MFQESRVLLYALHVGLEGVGDQCGELGSAGGDEQWRGGGSGHPCLQTCDEGRCSQRLTRSSNSFTSCP